MADFWIKVEKSTPDKAEIFEMAALLDIDPDAVLGKLIRVWSWIDSNSEDGHIKSVTHVLIDRVTNCGGFSKAMKDVGWLGENEVPNFDRHLGENAKKRAKDAERKRKSRSTSKECPQESVTESGLDKIKIREDKDKKEITITDGKPPASKSESINFDPFIFLGMTEDQIMEVKKIRKDNKGGKITQRVINALSKEFKLTINRGFTIETILDEWASRGWKSYKDEWMNSNLSIGSAIGKRDNGSALAGEFESMFSNGEFN